MVLSRKKLKRRISNGEVVDYYWSDNTKLLTFVFSKAPVVVRTRRKDIIKSWKEQGAL